MTDRRVTATGKDAEGDITRLCKSGEWWSPRSKADAISDIELGINTYYVMDSVGNRADIHVMSSGSKKYLRTTADSSSANNLDNLPDC
ncbi:DUF3892 domain-containing protein [Halomonas venusta]|uniref:DUF3892 domain-containing protein n=1 Tax=Vreelandella venusta TaxID=44935 RepID=UPI00295E8C18|nr:DUF3892 domain-containing protein [Halomonas venusta]MDW0357702.1 DUF3892 domain-containing protein [Halomonas venusta]